ncbi:UNVERIFIED_CONTAM: hypothetical protein HDU68_010749 [Siphonaria sp. JEL0065]|nr:hypothetical protein HDU68_010749 [Siphonaria sp. JEL0065]
MTIIVSAADTTPSPARISLPAKILFTPALPRNLNPSQATGVVSIKDSAVTFSIDNRDYAIDYPSIVIYAISRAPPCIYCQLDEMVVESELKQDSAAAVGAQATNGEEEEEEQDPTFEMRIIPDDPSKRKAFDDLFMAITECAALHPDKNAMDEEEDDDEGWMMTADDFNNADIDGARQAALDHLESVFVGGVRKETEDRFEDAEEGDSKRVKEYEGER